MICVTLSSGVGIVIRSVEMEMFQDRINLAGEVVITIVNGNLAVGETGDSFFKAICRSLPGSVVSHGDGDGGGRTSC